MGGTWALMITVTSLQSATARQSGKNSVPAARFSTDLSPDLSPVLAGAPSEAEQQHAALRSRR